MLKLVLKTLGWFCVLLGVVGPTAALYVYATRAPQVDAYFEVLRDYTALPEQSPAPEAGDAKVLLLTDSRAKADEMLQLLAELESAKLRAATPSDDVLNEQFINATGKEGGAE